MIHEVLPDRLMMNINQAHIFINIKPSVNSEVRVIYNVIVMLHWRFTFNSPSVVG